MKYIGILLLGLCLMAGGTEEVEKAEDTERDDKNRLEWCNDEVKVVIELEKTCYKPGEEIELQFAISKVTDDEIRYYWTSSYREFSVTITDEAKQEAVPLTEKGELRFNPATMSRMITKLAKDRPFNDRISLSESFDLSAASEYVVSLKGKYENPEKEWVSFKVEGLTFSIENEPSVTAAPSAD